MQAHYFVSVAAVSGGICLIVTAIGIIICLRKDRHGFQVENAGKSNCQERVENERCVCLALGLVRLAFMTYGVLSLVWGCCHFAWSFYSFGFWAVTLCVSYFAFAFVCSLAMCFQETWCDQQFYGQRALDVFAHLTLGLYELAWTFSVLDAVIFWTFSDHANVHDADAWNKFLLLSRHGGATLAPLFLDGLANQMMVQCTHFWISQIAIMFYFGLIWTSDYLAFGDKDPATDSVNWLQTTAEWQHLDCQSPMSLLWYPSIQAAAIVTHFILMAMHRGRCYAFEKEASEEELTRISHQTSTPFTATTTKYSHMEGEAQDDEVELHDNRERNTSTPRDLSKNAIFSTSNLQFHSMPFEDRETSKTETLTKQPEHSKTTELPSYTDGHTPHLPAYKGHRRTNTNESLGTTNSEGTENGQSGGSGSDNDSTTLEVKNDNNRSHKAAMEPIPEASGASDKSATRDGEEYSYLHEHFAEDIGCLIHLDSKINLEPSFSNEQPSNEAEAAPIQTIGPWTAESGMPRTSHSLSRTPPACEGSGEREEEHSPLSSQYRSINSPVRIIERPLGFQAKSGRNQTGGRVTSIAADSPWADHGMAPGLYFDTINGESVRAALWVHIRTILKEGELPLTITFWHGPVIQNCFDQLGIPVRDHGMVTWEELQASELTQRLGLGVMVPDGETVVRNLFLHMNFDGTGIVDLADYQRNLATWIYHIKKKIEEMHDVDDKSRQG